MISVVNQPGMFSNTKTNTGPYQASFLFLLGLSFLALILVGCQQQQVEHLTGRTMGTFYNVKWVADIEHDSSALQVEIDALLVEINQSLSTYVADSEINQLSQQAVAEPFAMSGLLAPVDRLSRQIWQLSDGAFDPTIGPLVDLWGFGPSFHADQIPADSEIDQRLENVGYQYLEVDDQGRLVKRKAVAVDYSAIAKGFGVDRVAELLEHRGISRYLVEIGGEIRVSGTNASTMPWRLAIETPDLSGGIQASIALQQGAVATSGNYRNFFEVDGVRYAHTLDPTTGRPVQRDVVSATVIAPTCAEADGWATAFMVLGSERALEIADREGLALYLVRANGEGYEAAYSKAYQPYLNNER